MPGTGRLAPELNVGKNTIEQALLLLEEEGYLVNQGRARRRLIRIPGGATRNSQLRVAIMLYESEDRETGLMFRLFTRLQSSGFLVQVGPKSLRELKMDPERVARSVGSIKADAWIVGSGSHEVLEWFANRPTPVMALGGRGRRLPIALTGVETSPARAELVRKLHGLGHRRIVMISERVRREPPGLPEQTVLNELERLGIKTSSYHLPDWGDTPGELRACLDSLFKVTPAQALSVGTPGICLGVRDHLQQRGIRIPRDVSLISIGNDVNFDWLHPQVARIEYDSDQLIRKCIQWLRSVERGKPSQQKSYVKAKLVDGGSIGPAPTSKGTKSFP